MKPPLRTRLVDWWARQPDGEKIMGVLSLAFGALVVLMVVKAVERM